MKSASSARQPARSRR